MYRIAYLFIIITGFTALVYQVTWHKYIAFYLGSHAMAASLVLAVFFGSLSIGYAIFGKYLHRIPIRNKLFAYGILEALIGLYAILSPRIYHLLTDIIPAGSGNPLGDFALGFMFASALIGIPTFLMGGTIPVLTQAMSRDFEGSHGVHGRVYGLNTLGAVLGASLAGLVLIDAWGLPLTLLNIGMMNIAIGFATYIMFKIRPDGFEGVKPTKEVSDTAHKQPKRIMISLFGISFLSGFYVFSLENLLIRVVGLSIGSTNYAYSMTVAAFVLGIALGSIWVARRKIESLKFFLVVQICLLVAASILYWAIPHWPELFARLKFVFAPALINVDLYWISAFSLFSVILLIPVALMGMNLPIIFNYLRSRDAFLSQTVGRIYSINTLGSVLGSLIGGYLIFYVLRWDQVFVFNLMLISASIIIIALALKRSKIKLTGLGIGVSAIVLLPFLPGWDDDRFVPSVNLIRAVPNAADSPEEIFQTLRSSIETEFIFHGPSAHIAVLRDEEAPQLHINGNPNTGHSDFMVRAMNAIYPLAFSAKPENVFVIGLGGGLSTSIFAEMPSVEKVVVSEIAIGAIHALPYFDEQNSEFTTQDYFNKAEFIGADAIQVLRSSNQQYDIIVSEPNHPWVAGVENLFTAEFLTEVRNRMTEDGVYCQWFPLFDVPPAIVQQILNTFTEVFPTVRVFASSPGTLSIIAGKSQLTTNSMKLKELESLFGQRFPEDNFFKNIELLLASELISPSMLKLAMEPIDTVLSFERPSVASRSFEAKFANIRTSFNATIGELIHQLPQNEIGITSFAINLAEEAISAELLDQAYATFTRSGYNWAYIIPRIWYYRTTQFDSDPDWPDVLFKNTWQYLTGLSEAPPNPDSESNETMQIDMQEGEADNNLIDQGVGGGTETISESPVDPIAYAALLFNEHRRLIKAGVPSRMQRVLRHVPDTCSEERCFDLKLTIAGSVFAYSPLLEEIQSLDPSKSEDQSIVADIYTQAVSAVNQREY